MIIQKDELKGLNKKSAKLIEDMSKEEKIVLFEFAPIPQKIIDNISDYPESPFHSDKKWKIIDYTENPDGSAHMKFLKNDEKIGTKEMSFSGILWFSDDDTFNREKAQYEKGILKEISERTVEMHIVNNTFKQKDKSKIKVISRFGTQQLNFSEVK